MTASVLVMFCSTASERPILEPTSGHVTPRVLLQMQDPEGNPTEDGQMPPVTQKPCVAAASVHPIVCPQYTKPRAAPGFEKCNPNAIKIGEEVPIQICVQNWSEMLVQKREDSTVPVQGTFTLPVEMSIQTQLGGIQFGYLHTFTVFLAAITSIGSGSHKGVLAYEGFEPIHNGTSFRMGGSDTCTDPEACGLLSVKHPVVLPAERGKEVCLGIIKTRAVGLPDMPDFGSGAMAPPLAQTPDANLRTIFIGAHTRGPAFVISDRRCLPDLTASAQGFTIAVFEEQPPPSLPSPPVLPPPSPQPPATIEKDPHLHFAHGGTADFRGLDGQLYNFFSAPNLAVNLKTEHAVFKLNEGLLTVNGSFITEFHLVARVGTCRVGSKLCLGGTKRKWANFSLWASELNEDR